MHSDDGHVKVSKKRQWREKSEKPIATRPMSHEEMEMFRVHLTASYKCGPKDIVFDFQKITDEYDMDRSDSIVLVYKMVNPDTGVYREIFSMKIPVPCGVRGRAEEIRMASKAGPTIVDVTDDLPSTPARREVLRPVRRS